MHTEGVL